MADKGGLKKQSFGGGQGAKHGGCSHVLWGIKTLLWAIFDMYMYMYTTKTDLTFFSVVLIIIDL